MVLKSKVKTKSIELTKGSAYTFIGIMKSLEILRRLWSGVRSGECCYDMEGENRVHTLRYRDERKRRTQDIYRRHQPRL